MKVKILKSFTAFVGDNSISACEGQEIDMPAGQDWIRVGLAAPIKKAALESEAPETAALQPPEAAVVPRSKKRKPG